MPGILRGSTSIHCQTKCHSQSSWMEKAVTSATEEQHHKQVQSSMGISRTLVAVLFGVFCFLSVVNGAMNVTIHPSDLTVETGSQADFTCTISCEYYYSHTLYWFVGQQPLHIRRFFYNTFRVQSFETASGIDVSINETDPCMGPGGVLQPTQILTQVLSIYVSSSAMDRTPVQCAAIRTDPSFIDFYSFYSMLLVQAVEGPTDATTDPPASSSSTPALPTGPGEEHTPSPTPVYCENTTTSLTITNFVGVTVTQTLTVTETVLVTPLPAVQNPRSGTLRAAPLWTLLLGGLVAYCMLSLLLSSSSAHL